MIPQTAAAAACSQLHPNHCCLELHCVAVQAGSACCTVATGSLHSSSAFAAFAAASLLCPAVSLLRTAMQALLLTPCRVTPVAPQRGAFVGFFWYCTTSLPPATDQDTRRQTAKKQDTEHQLSGRCCCCCADVVDLQRTAAQPLKIHFTDAVHPHANHLCCAA
jgi:hypothetical protein